MGGGSTLSTKMLTSRQLGMALLTVGALCMPFISLAATKTWDGGGSDNLWSTPANWSSDTRPGTGDTIIFDGTGKKDAIILSNSFKYDIGELRLGAANTGTLTVRKPLTILRNISLSGGTLTVASGAQITVKGSWQNGGGTLSAGTGTVLLAGSGTNYVLKETGAFRNLSLDDGLVGHWRFDEVTGTGALDSGRNQNNGMYKNGTARSTTVPTLGFQNTTSALFDGVNDYIETTMLGTFGQTLDTGPLAVSLWFNMSSIGVDGATLLGTLNTGTNTGFYLYIYTLMALLNGSFGAKVLTIRILL